MDKILCQNLNSFQSLIKRSNPDEIVEMGLCYKTEITDKKGQTIVREKEFPFPDKEKLVKTYQKVVFVKEADTQEKEQAQKGRNFLKSIFQDFFEDKKVRQIITFLLGVLGSYHIYQKNLLPVLICLVGIIGLKTMKPQTKKETRKNTTPDKEGIMEELNNLGLSTLLYDTEKVEDINLYVKQVMRRCLPQKSQNGKDLKEMLLELSILLKYIQWLKRDIIREVIQTWKEDVELQKSLENVRVAREDLLATIEKGKKVKSEWRREAPQVAQQFKKQQEDLQQSVENLRAISKNLLAGVEKSRNLKLRYGIPLQV